MRVLFLFIFLLSVLPVSSAQAERKGLRLFPYPLWDWSKSHKDYRQYKKFNPYLENLKHSQHLQYKDEDWYVEDWTAQKDGMTIIRDFYKADIFKKQKVGYSGLPELVVGPNFYRLSGLDKRRAMTLVDSVYKVTEREENGSFIVSDWHTKKPIGLYDKHGFRLY